MVKRWWGVRHVRYFLLRAELFAWFGAWKRQGGPGLFINPSDWAYLDAVWRGEV